MVRHAQCTRCDALRKRMYSVYRFIKSTKTIDALFLLFFDSPRIPVLDFLSLSLPPLSPDRSDREGPLPRGVSLATRSFIVSHGVRRPRTAPAISLSLSLGFSYKSGSAPSKPIEIYIFRIYITVFVRREIRTYRRFVGCARTSSLKFVPEELPNIDPSAVRRAL